jgi:hypothetical protein
MRDWDHRFVHFGDQRHRVFGVQYGKLVLCLQSILHRLRKQLWGMLVQFYIAKVS